MRIDHLQNKSTRENRRCIIKKFLGVVGIKDSYDEYDAMKFFDWANEHYSGQSILLVYSIIKWLYARMGFNFSDIAYPEYDNNNVYALPNDDIGKLIGSIDKFSLTLQLLVALSTTYGMRRIEMNRVAESDINLDNNKIFVRTAKSGKSTQRWMYIPPEIRPVLSTYKQYCNKIVKLTHTTISAYFWKACNIAQVPLNQEKRIGWHSIRRSLVIGLTNSGLSDNTIIQFMRWKHKDNASSILYRYRSTQDNDSIIETIDKEVFEAHPFTKLWTAN